MKYPFKVGQKVRAIRQVTEGGGCIEGKPGAKFPEAAYIHAEEGDLGCVEGIDDETPTVRFCRTETATIVGKDEVEAAEDFSCPKEDPNLQQAGTLTDELLANEGAIECWNCGYGNDVHKLYTHGRTVSTLRCLNCKAKVGAYNALANGWCLVVSDNLTTQSRQASKMMAGLRELLTPEQQKELDETGNIMINLYRGRKIPMFPELDYAQMESRVAAAMLKDPCYGCKNMEGMLSGQSCEGCEHWPFAQAAYQHKKAAVELRFKPDYKITKEQLEAAAKEGEALMELVEKQVSDAALEAYAKFVEGEILRQRHAWKQRTFGMRYGRPPAWFRKQVKEGDLQGLFDMVPQTPTVTDPGDDPEEE